MEINNNYSKNLFDIYSFSHISHVLFFLFFKYLKVNFWTDYI